MILVDSSVWIEAWRGRNPSLAKRLARLIEGEQATINPLIRTELLQGARDLRHQQLLCRLLEPIAIQPLSNELWEVSPRFYLTCRKHSVTLTTIDALIAAHAQVGNMKLWSLDQVYEKMPRFAKHLFSTR